VRLPEDPDFSKIEIGYHRSRGPLMGLPTLLELWDVGGRTYLQQIPTRLRPDQTHPLPLPVICSFAFFACFIWHEDRLLEPCALSS
jgi:hypothetical protein